MKAVTFMRSLAILLNIMNLPFLIFCIDYRTSYETSTSAFAFTLTIVPAWLACLGSIGFLFVQMTRNSHQVTLNRALFLGAGALILLANAWVLFYQAVGFMEGFEDLGHYQWVPRAVFDVAVPSTTITAILLRDIKFELRQ